MAANMAPGMNREFLSENWPHLIPKRCWYDAVNEANDCLDLSVETVERCVRAMIIDRRDYPGGRGPMPRRPVWIF